MPIFVQVFLSKQLLGQIEAFVANKRRDSPSLLVAGTPGNVDMSDGRVVGADVSLRRGPL